MRIVEIFYSIQGEGKFVGSPSVFVRLFGCNFQCAGFGQPRDNIIPIEEMPHNKFDISKCDSIESLPVFDIGCDSSAAWSKKYRHLTTDMSVSELNDECEQTYLCTTNSVPHCVITGGEPLLRKNQSFLAEFIETSVFKHFTIETNGTQPLTDEFVSKMKSLSKDGVELTFSVSSKLSISGEKWNKAIVPKSVQTYLDLIEKLSVGEVYLKFVVRDAICVPEVHQAISEYDFDGNVYLMPEGATDKGISITEREVSELCLIHGFKFSPRLHINLYGNSWGT